MDDPFETLHEGAAVQFTHLVNFWDHELASSELCPFIIQIFTGFKSDQSGNNGHDTERPLLYYFQKVVKFKLVFISVRSQIRRSVYRLAYS